MARDPMLPLRLKMMEQGYTQKQLCGEIGCCEGYFVQRIMCRRLNNEDGGERANLQEADLQEADLQGTNLRGTNLQGTNLRGTNLDYSCWPLWCGSLDVIVDKRIAAQLAYHFCRFVCDDPEVQAAQQAIKGLANQFHRVNECGVIK